MELFTPQPDLSLRISPPNTQPTSQNHHHDSTTRYEPSFATHVPTNSNDSSLTHITYTTLQHQHDHDQGLSLEQGLLMPIKGIPVYYQNTHPNLQLLAQYHHHHQINNPSLDTSTLATSTSSSSSLTNSNCSNNIARSRFMCSRFPVKRSVRAPRMRWTTALHARFVHAVELLGGHESMF